MMQRWTDVSVLTGLCLWLIIPHSLPAQTGRYVSRCFSDIQIQKRIVYGYADPYDRQGDSTLAALTLDFYEPAGDTLSQRPLVMMFFGGAFYFDQPKFKRDVRAWCDSLTHYGYTCATVYYRVGFDPFSQASAIRAGYRGIQDGRAAIRFFKAHADSFRIDPKRIFVGGNSSGAIISLHSAFLQESERPAVTYGYKEGRDSSDLGCVDCSGNDYPPDHQVAGIISLWGGMFRPDFIDPEEYVPTLFIHGSADGVVPIGKGKGISLPWFPEIYGARSITQYLDSLGLPYKFVEFKGRQHSFYHQRPLYAFPNKEWDRVWYLGRTFLAKLMEIPSGATFETASR